MNLIYKVFTLADKFEVFIIHVCVIYTVILTFKNKKPYIKYSREIFAMPESFHTPHILFCQAKAVGNFPNLTVCSPQ